MDQWGLSEHADKAFGSLSGGQQQRLFVALALVNDPDVVFLENVASHLTLGFARVRRDLESRGYRVTRGLFTAEEVGATHERARLFILAVADSERGQPLQYGGDELADSRRKGLEKRGFKPGNASQELEAAERSGGELADSERHGRGQGSETLFPGTGEPITSDESETIPLFAPGYGDLREWARIIRIDPALEPAFCRIPDGYALGLDTCRLRTTGNGVAPIQAAYAFVTLWAALEYGQGFC